MVLEHYEQGIPLHRQAVLFRAAAHSNSLEIALGRRNIPFRKYGGLRFLEAAHIKDLVCFLRVLENPRDEIAWFRILQLLSGVGPATAAAVIEHLRENEFKHSALSSFIAPAAAQPELTELASLIVELGSFEDNSPGKQLDRIRAFYQPLMPRKYENPTPREQDIEYLNSLADRYESRGQFLADLVLDPPTATGDLAGPPIKDEDWLVLSTIHSAKGLEWDVVYLIQAADGYLPSDMSTGTAEEIEEELRVTYVAMTRARDHLYVLWPQRMYTQPQGLSDKHSYAQRSRFLNEEVVKTMDQVLAVRPAGGRGSGLDSGKPRDIGKRIEDLWK
jgi:DNA helicase-2/ATP-dependent DNA helicase PcrA